jgi:hypothetical protein
MASSHTHFMDTTGLKVRTWTGSLALEAEVYLEIAEGQYSTVTFSGRADDLAELFARCAREAVRAASEARPDDVPPLAENELRAGGGQMSGEVDLVVKMARTLPCVYRDDPCDKHDGEDGRKPEEGFATCLNCRLRRLAEFVRLPGEHR